MYVYPFSESLAFISFFLFELHLQHKEVSLSHALNQSFSCELHNSCGNARSLTHCVGPGIKLSSLHCLWGWDCHSLSFNWCTWPAYISSIYWCARAFFLCFLFLCSSFLNFLWLFVCLKEFFCFFKVYISFIVCIIFCIIIYRCTFSWLPYIV